VVPASGARFHEKKHVAVSCGAEDRSIIAAMARQAVSTSAAPKAIGPYTQAVVATGPRTIYCSGQIPLDPATGELVGIGDLSAQTHRIMQNLRAVLEAAGASLDAVVKTTIFLTDLASFAEVNEAYGSYFSGAPPARSTVEVAGLPRGAQVEIDAVAVVDG
jgi:2-iminobutanoate/2-iminopropanoate deaminase